MRYRESVDWLFGVTRFGMKLGLENTRELLRQLDLPHPGLRIIHVAGTNGKGSTCSFAHSCLHAAGVCTGLFTSPHLIDFRERIRVGEEMISEEDTARLLAVLRQRAEAMDPHPTFFEIAFALALLHFRETKVEAAVIETGLGGKLDATNTITPAVSVITRIGTDHKKWLGNSLAEIAAEKAGIIKPGVPTVSAPQDPDALTVIQNRAAELGAPLQIIEPKAYPPASSLGLKGEHQRENAALAAAALLAGGFDVPPDAIGRGLSSVNWPARFQILTLPEFSAPLVVDGAHNPQAARVLVDTWRTEFPDQKATVLYSAADGKDATAFIGEILPIASRIVLTQSSSSRARPPAELKEALGNVVPQTLEVTTLTAPASALSDAAKYQEPVLVTGSLFLAGDVLALIKGKSDPDPSEKL